jgi:hypothetical protein
MFKLLFIIILFFTFNTTFSQVDSLKNKLISDSEISLGGTLITGGLDLFTIKSTLKTDVDYKNINSKTYLQYSFNKTFDNVIQNDFFCYDIITIGKNNLLHPKFAGMYEKSRIRSIKNYYVVGVGIGLNILAKENYKLVLMNILSFEGKEFYKDELLNYNGIRYSVILKGKYALLKNKIILKHNFFINPFLFKATNNYRYRLLIDLLMPISKKLFAKASFNYSNESIVDTGFEPINTTTTFGLSLKF